MFIGLISDTHGLVRPEIFSALADVELILHAGDVGGAPVLDELRASRPLRVYGTPTRPTILPCGLPSTSSSKGSVHVSHGHEISGSHTPEDSWRVTCGRGRVRTHAKAARRACRLAPRRQSGAAGARRFKLQSSVARLTLTGARSTRRSFALKPRPPRLASRASDFPTTMSNDCHCHFFSSRFLGCWRPTQAVRTRSRFACNGIRPAPRRARRSLGCGARSPERVARGPHRGVPGDAVSGSKPWRTIRTVPRLLHAHPMGLDSESALERAFEASHEGGVSLSCDAAIAWTTRCRARVSLGSEHGGAGSCTAAC